MLLQVGHLTTVTDITHILKKVVKVQYSGTSGLLILLRILMDYNNSLWYLVSTN